MFKTRKINPIARAVGVMGATAALVTGVTFANMQSNAVALSPNELTTGSASLQIGDGACSGPSLSAVSTPGMSASNFSVSHPASVSFCLVNTGDVPLVISATVTSGGDLNGDPAAQNTTLTVSCGSDPAVSGALNTSWSTTFATALGSGGGAEGCTATAKLSPSYTSGSGEIIPSFDINFVGTEPTPAT